MMFLWTWMLALATASQNSASRNKAYCGINELLMPENGDKWSCNKEIINGKVKKGARCTIICIEGHDMQKGKGRLGHRCKKGGIWHEPEKVALRCEPNAYFFREMAKNLTTKIELLINECPSMHVSTESSTKASIETSSATSTESPNKSSIKHILVLSTASEENENVPMIISTDGNVNTDFEFKYGGRTEVFGGCGAVFNGEMMYFGGLNEPWQVSKIEKCKMKRQPLRLPFYFQLGACNTFMEPVELVLLCFNINDRGGCHTFDGENFNQIEESRYRHSSAGLGNYRGRGFTTGCSDSDDCSIKTEILNISSMTWSIAYDYPFSDLIVDYSTASSTDAVYIIGGNMHSNIVAQFKDDQWSRLPDLMQGRDGQASISVGKQIIVLGGYTNGPATTEIWNFETGVNEVIAPLLPQNSTAYGVALYFVDEDFCSK